ncbi:hypothetical protein OIU79_010240 [Salix purpurea]|uniref:Uncharacterized protein n=1 Tax=Salix purpurea TaxID=77065 RepID=A0A9Q0QG92_SALPP|nr:hypothetical protein OIU79_010240 [Salix purpurea]
MEHIGVVWGLVPASQNVPAMENEEECFTATSYGDSLSRSILFLEGNVLGICLPTREFNGEVRDVNADHRCWERPEGTEAAASLSAAPVKLDFRAISSKQLKI